MDRFGGYVEARGSRSPDLTPKQFAVLFSGALMASFTPKGRERKVMKAALLRPAPRVIAEPNFRACARCADPATGAAVADAVICSLLLGLVGSPSPALDEIEAILRRVLTLSPALAAKAPARAEVAA
ncbi:hypothetical protein ACFWM7_23555 [Streptomyces sp. NPDC058375]|uniref:hypothetical protein n=1 Tax=Streptomyces sp. NPDC058375 TaxID=3346467 RepID=UPI003664933E